MTRKWPEILGNAILDADRLEAQLRAVNEGGIAINTDLITVVRYLSTYRPDTYLVSAYGINEPLDLPAGQAAAFAIGYALAREMGLDGPDFGRAAMALGIEGAVLSMRLVLEDRERQRLKARKLREEVREDEALEMAKWMSNALTDQPQPETHQFKIERLPDPTPGKPTRRTIIGLWRRRSS